MCTPSLRVLAALLIAAWGWAADAPRPPNIVLIYADDLGYGDLGCYGATRIRTPRIDRLAAEGLRFTDAHTAAATCTPSRYALLTGEYPWRREGIHILSGSAHPIIDPSRITLASLLRSAGYATACVGKWHLGLGSGRIDWNREIKPGPLELGFDESFIMAATGDRVPCVYIRDRHVVGLDPADPIRVSYDRPLDDAPTGASRPDLLTMRPTRGHADTIVNGISRKGFMAGGTRARWVDQDMSSTFVREAVAFIERRRDQRFFLYLAVHEPHVPRVPSPAFAGSSPCGPRGDVIQEFDHGVGVILDTLDRLGLARDTLVLVSSDNGPVLNDGYADGAVEKVGDHRPAGPLRGGKYSASEGGTRVPFIVRWPGRVAPGVSDALIGQIDLLATFASLVGRELPAQAGPDSLPLLPTLLGQQAQGRDHLVQLGGPMAMREGAWKCLWTRGEAHGAKLYDLANDIGETTDLAQRQPDRVAAMTARLQELRRRGRTRQ